MKIVGAKSVCSILVEMKTDTSKNTLVYQAVAIYSAFILFKTDFVLVQKTCLCPLTSSM